MAFEYTRHNFIQQLKRRARRLKEYRANTTKSIIKLEQKIKRLQKEETRGRPKVYK